MTARNYHLKFIKASAGSGKTYQLALHYLKLLSGTPPNLSTIRSIVAMTFTNKAAAEMKYRILRFLKEIAFNTPDGQKLGLDTGISQDGAIKWLDIILRNYEDFRVQTIDSFVFSLLRAMAWEIRIRPDMEPEFNVNRIIETVFNRLLLKIGTDAELYEIFKETLRCFLEMEVASGFNPERYFKKRLVELFETVTTGGLSAGLEYNPGKLDQARERLENLIRKLIYFTSSDEINKLALEALENKKFDSTFFYKNHVKELLKRSALKSLSCNEKLDEIYRELKKRLNEYLIEFATAKIAPYIRLLERFEKEANNLFNREGIIPAGRWLNIVKENLSEANIPHIYYFLGERLKHFLIDEFQDTSKLQWEVLAPLVRNAVSVNGTFLYVGDPKQSIYMWRGADPTIFMEVKEEFSRFDPQKEVLKKNWRSAPGIVSFNNNLFSALNDSPLVEEIVKDCIKNLDSEAYNNRSVLSSYVNYIVDSFEDVQQEVSAARVSAVSENCVEVIKISGSNAEERNEEIRRCLLCKIRALAERGISFSDITVLVRTNEQSRMVFSWLWSNGIVAVTEHSLRIERAPTIRSLMNFLRFINNPKDETSLYGFLSSGLAEGVFGISADELILGAKDENISLDAYIRKYHKDFYNSIFTQFIMVAGYETAYDIVWRAINYFNIKSRFPDELSFILRFLELINSMEEKLGRFISLSEFVSMWEKEGVEEHLGIPEGVGAELLGATDDDNKGAVRIMTIHGSKGLEFPVVFVPFLDWSLKNPSIIHLKSGRLVRVSKPYPKEVKEELLKKRLNDLVESLNLFYVALTRAKDYLVIMVPESARQLGKVFQKIISSRARPQEMAPCIEN